MSKRTVNIIMWSMYEPLLSRKYIQVSKVIDPKEPIREVAIDILKTQNEIALGSGEAIKYEELPLIVKPMSSKATLENFNDLDQYTFGPEYLIRTDKSIQLLRGLESMRPWTVEQFDELKSAGYIDYKTDNIIVVVPEGIGATGHVDSIIEMVRTLSTIVGIGRVVISTPRFVSFILRWFTDAKARHLAKQWIKQGIRYPNELREFIDLKAGWSVSEVKTRLRINEEYAVKLLSALGLEPVGNEWRLTHSKESIHSRKRWMANERYWNKKRYEGV